MNDENRTSTEATIEALNTRVESQRQWLMATFVLAIVALVLAVMMFVQIARLRADVAAQLDRLYEAQNRQALDAILRTGISPGAAAASDPTDAASPVEAGVESGDVAGEAPRGAAGEAE